MPIPTASREFPRPSSLKVVPGTEGAQAAYPYYMQFTPGDDSRFWFYNSMHFPEPMSAFDMVTAEAAYCALGAANTRVHCLPTTLGIDYRILNGRVYIGGNGVTDPAEIARRTEEFKQRAFYYYENWERLYTQWRAKMLALIKDALGRRKTENGQKAADLIVLNAGAALYVAGLAGNLRDGVHMAHDALFSGLALDKLQELVSFTAVFRQENVQ